VCGEFTVACAFINVEDHFIWAFTGVCDPNVDGEIIFL
jgi:hypothetical protein